MSNTPLGNDWPMFGGGPKPTPAELRRRDLAGMAVRNAERDRRTARAFEEEREETARRAAAAKRHQAEQDEAARAEVARLRSQVEADLRRAGAPESDVRRLADQALAQHFAARATETLERGPKVEAELKAYFARQGSTALRYDIPGEG